MYNGYSALAPFYDRLNRGEDYDARAAFITSLLSRYKINPPSSVIDAGCGTGQITARLAAAGYSMTGVDLSPDMLTLAEKKTAGLEPSPFYICYDMSSLSLEQAADAAVSCLDSVNYLTAPGQLAAFFSAMHDCIRPGGLFVFDVNTRKKFETVYADNAYVLEDDGLLCAWQNYYNKKSSICTFSLSIFAERKDGGYDRFDEEQKERCFPSASISRALVKCGFDIAAVVSDYDMSPACEDDLRHYYICVRK